jgi:imidazolonepropionase
MVNCPNTDGFEVIDVLGKYILPTWCDSHTHIVYAGNREQEFVDRINGLTYEEIANKGGGILNSAKLLNQTDENEIYEQSKKRLLEVIQLGTGAVEIKSGYGLTVEGELKMLRVIKRLASELDLPIKATFLGAHAFPLEYKNNQQGYIDLLINEMLPQIKAEKLADFIDVFCETGYFSVAQTEQIMQAGTAFGLIPKIHVNQFTAIGGIKAGVELFNRAEQLHQGVGAFQDAVQVVFSEYLNQIVAHQFHGTAHGVGFVQNTGKCRRPCLARLHGGIDSRR